MEEAKGPSLTLAGKLDEQLRRHEGQPWHALLEVVAAPAHEAELLRLQLHGKVLGGVELTRILGTGGMGVAYEGIDADGQRVAVKVFGHLDEAATLRFEGECLMLRTLHHAGIVRYRSHGVSKEEGAYLVMDYVAGTDLERILSALEKRTALDEVGETIVLGIEGEELVQASASYRRRIVRIVASVADALAHAHGAGIVHRDVKPANIVVQKDASPVLIDFGLGRDLFRELSWTRSGAVVGTVGWMAPEQLDGSVTAIGPRTDVFALGLVLYRALTGRELRRNLVDLHRFGRGPLRLRREERADLEAPLLGILHGCLEPAPGRRYAGAAALAADLRAWLAGEAPSRRAPGPMRRLWREPLGRTGLLAALSALVLFASWLAWPQTSRVSIMGMEDHKGGTLSYRDGRQLDCVLPVQDLVLPRGDHELVYRSDRLNTLDPVTGATVALEIPFVIKADREFVRVNVFHETPGLVPELGEESGVPFSPETGLLDFSTRNPPRSLSIDGQVHAMQRVESSMTGNGVAPASWRARIRLPVGRHRLEFVTESGQRGQQVFDIAPMQVEPCCLFQGHLAQVEGAIRIEWASVLATTPPELAVSLGGVAGRFMDGGAEVREDPLHRLERGLVYLDRNTSVSPLAADREAEVLLRVAFPRPVRSILAALKFECARRAGNSLRIEWRLDEGDWQPGPRIEDGRLTHGSADPYAIRGIEGFVDTGAHALDIHGLPGPGASTLEIRCVMTSAQVNQGSVFVRFLDARVNDPGCQTPAFELVADPDPSPRSRR